MTQQPDNERKFEFDLPTNSDVAQLFPNAQALKGRRIKGQTKSPQTIAEIMQAFINSQRKS